MELYYGYHRLILLNYVTESCCGIILNHDYIGILTTDSYEETMLRTYIAELDYGGILRQICYGKYITSDISR